MLRPNKSKHLLATHIAFPYLAAMQYSIIQTSRNAEINNERGQYIGIMEFNQWKPAKVRYTSADNNIYETATIGFWQNENTISMNGMAFAEIKMKLGKGYIISFINGPTFLFRKKGFWNASEYVLIDNADSQVASLRSYFRWKIFKYQYDIDINESLLTKEVNDVMPFLIVYCNRLMRMRQGAAAAVFPIIFR